MAKDSHRTWSATYWENRYATGGNSGKGSYGEFAEFKARILNEFVWTQQVRDVIELGCGDGNQLQLANYPKYHGYDVSETAVRRCRLLFGDDASKSFSVLGAGTQVEQADLALSLDVIYHLVEDDIFAQHMKTLFASARRFVAIYASNRDATTHANSRHVRHRRFTDWIAKNEPAWNLIEHLENVTSSPSQFFFYQKNA